MDGGLSAPEGAAEWKMPAEESPDDEREKELLSPDNVQAEGALSSQEVVNDTTMQSMEPDSPGSGGSTGPSDKRNLGGAHDGPAPEIGKGLFEDGKEVLKTVNELDILNPGH